MAAPDLPDAIDAGGHGVPPLQSSTQSINRLNHNSSISKVQSWCE